MGLDGFYEQVNERLLGLLDELDAIVYVIAIDTYEVLYINNHGKSLWGDIVGEKCWETVRINQQGPCEDCTNNILAHLEHDGFHRSIYLDPINHRWLDSRSHMINWLSGKKAKLGIAMDITDRKRVEEELVISESRFKTLVDNAPSVIYSLSEEGLFTFVSPSWTELLGHDLEDVIGRHFFEFIHPEDIDHCMGAFQEVMDTRGAQRRVTYRVKHMNGSWHWHKSSGSAVANEDQNFLYFIGVANDITELIENEQQLLQANQELESALEEIITIEEELRAQYQQLEKQEGNLRDVMQLQEDIIQFLPDATFVVDQNGIILSWNHAMEIMTGMQASQVVGKGDYEYALPFYKKRRPVIVDLVLRYDQDHAQSYGDKLRFEVKNTIVVEDFYLCDGETGRYLSIKASPLLNSKGEIVGAIESIRDVTARKQAEDQLRYMAEHDSITGLYNRAYFEKEIHNGLNDSGRMIGVVVSDLDGLKLVNDTLGHQEGDKLLQESAQILTAAFPKGSRIMRIGGDEFCVILRNTTEEDLRAKLQELGSSVDAYNQKKPVIPLSISHGFACSDRQEVDLLALFKQAEEKMYEEKLHHRQSARSRVVDVLTKALEARDYITEGHADRLGEIVEKIGSAIGMHEYQLNHLRLFARFHDIGKVGISDTILFKPGRLSVEEFEEIKKHSEIGFRIAQSSSDLIHISDLILKHHEWWNGTGYPFGLSAKEIPLECRILAIADAYDSMSNDRPYRKALPYGDRIKELRHFSGIQFDPQLIETFLKILSP